MHYYRGANIAKGQGLRHTAQLEPLLATLMAPSCLVDLGVLP